MAESIALFLKLNGSDIAGENRQTSPAHANSIEVLSWSWSGDAPASSSGGASGRRVMGEVKFVQPIDKSTPLLFKAFTNNEVAQGVFKFFRPNADGTEEQFFTFEGFSGRVTSINPWLPDTINPATSTLPPLVQFTMYFNRVIQTYTNGGITHEWDVGSNA